MMVGSAGVMRELQMNFQSAVIVGAYQKAFRLDQQASADHSVGHIMNVVNVDSERIGTAVEYSKSFFVLMFAVFV